MATEGMTDTFLAEIQRSPLRHTVRTRIEEAIVQGMFKGGDKLNEAELSRALGVSRGLVREALRELESSGVLVSVPYRGTFVKEWTPRSVWELYTLRASLEEFAVELAVEHATDADIEGLAALVEAMRQAARKNDAAALVELDLEFHQRLAQMTGHRMLVQHLQSLGGQTRVFIIATKAFYSPFASLEEAAASHDPILEALRARDAKLARDALHAHIQQVGQRYVSQLEAESDQNE